MNKKQKEPVKRVNVNRMIRSPRIRLIGAEGDQLGIMTVDEAMSIALEHGQDVVEVAPDADPPVCRIMDFGRYKYEQSKRQRESKKKATVILIKEVKLRPKTEEHDYQFKLRNIRKFLEQKNKAKVSLMFRGREIAHANLARGMLDRIVTDVADLGVVEQPAKLEGRFMVMILAPKA